MAVREASAHRVPEVFPELGIADIGLFFLVVRAGDSVAKLHLYVAEHDVGKVEAFGFSVLAVTLAKRHGVQVGLMLCVYYIA